MSKVVKQYRNKNTATSRRWSLRYFSYGVLKDDGTPSYGEEFFRTKWFAKMYAFYWRHVAGSNQDIDLVDHWADDESTEPKK